MSSRSPQTAAGPGPGSNGVWDAVVVGAGPAGAVAAYHLARGGARVAILEQKPLPRYKTCGGGVVYRARRLIPFAIDAAVEHECYAARMAFFESGLSFDVSREHPLVTMTMRSTLDRMLLRRAETAGAHVFAPCAARDLHRTPHEVTIETDGNGKFRAGFVVAADGVLSPTARMAGWKRALAGIPAVEWELRTGETTRGKFHGTARFDFDRDCDGYSWVFPKREHLSVGTLSTGRGRSALSDRLERYLRRVGVDGVDGVEKHGFTIPVVPRDDGFVKSRVVLVGDAAGLADPITCEGISHAVLSGELAARVLLTQDHDEPRVRRAYEAELHERILGELRLARALARVLYRPSPFRRPLFARYGQELSEAMSDVIVGDTTYKEMLTQSSSYLRLIRDALAAVGVKIRGLFGG